MNVKVVIPCLQPMVAAMQVLSTAVQRAIVQHASGAAMLNLLQKQVKPPLANILVDVQTIGFDYFSFFSTFLYCDFL